jgi:tumor protein p53-inducible protein 3
MTADAREHDRGSNEQNEQMTAVIVQKPGGPEQLAIGRVPVPRLEAGSVEIEVAACALNRADLLQRRGAYPPPKGASDILGLECAGVVRGLLGDVGGLKIGDRVMALLAGGGYAARAVVPHGQVLPIPDGLSFTQAAAIPEAFLTASEALFQTGGLQANQWVLIHAAAGGVGSAAIQLARSVGARVAACAGSNDKKAWVERLGVDLAINYRDQDFVALCMAATDGRGVDVVLDFVGAAYAERHQLCLAEGGRWVVLGMLGGSEAAIDLSRVLRRRFHIAGLVMRTRSLADKQAIVARFRGRFLDGFRHGTFAPLIDRVYPLADVRAAHERMEKNENLGKIVLTLEA